MIPSKSMNKQETAEEEQEDEDEEEENMQTELQSLHECELLTICFQ